MRWRLTAIHVSQKTGYPPQRIDLLTTPDGVEFDDCWPDRILVEVGELQIPVIGLDGLSANKEAAARDQDLVDVAVLRRFLERQRRGGGPL